MRFILGELQTMGMLIFNPTENGKQEGNFCYTCN